VIAFGFAWRLCLPQLVFRFRRHVVSCSWPGLVAGAPGQERNLWTLRRWDFGAPSPGSCRDDSKGGGLVSSGQDTEICKRWKMEGFAVSLKLPGESSSSRAEYDVPVAKPPAISQAPRRRGNPNWGKRIEATPNVPTAFEEQVRKLGLNEQTCATSEKLKQWCERNKHRYYVPESLLKRWGIPVDPNISS